MVSENSAFGLVGFRHWRDIINRAVIITNKNSSAACVLCYNNTDMKDLIRRFSSFPKNTFIGVKDWSWQAKYCLLFDSCDAAQDVAFMLGGHWDGCNGVMIYKCDEVAVNTAASLVGAKWCYQGASFAFLIRLSTDELIKRYAAGERNFVNANLRCALLETRNLSEANLSWSKLSWANLSEANLSTANLTAADLSEANLSQANLRQTCLVGTNLTKANLSMADLRGANLSRACLSETNLTHADLRGANLSKADLSEAILSQSIGISSMQSELLHS